jgi:hypothetical protein
MDNNTRKAAVIAALSEGLDAQYCAAFEAGCHELLDYTPNNLDQANFLKLSLPIYTRVVRLHPERVTEAASVAKFVDQDSVEIVKNRPEDNWVDKEAEYCAVLADRYLRG